MMCRLLLACLLFGPALHAQAGQMIVFSREIARWNTVSSLDIRTYLRAVDPDGSHERDLKVSGIDAAVSPDGRLVAFCSNKDSSGYQVWVAAVTGENARRVLEVKDGASCEPAWAPDGKRLAFVLREKNAPATIAVVNLDGSGLHTLVSGNHPSWSGTGEAIVYQELAGKYLRIVVVNADGSGKRVLVEGDENDFAPAWSPDGKLIIFVSDRNDVCALYVSAADGSGSLHRIAYTDKGQLANPAWFPDSEHVAYEVGAHNASAMNSKQRCVVMMLPHVIAMTSVQSGGSRLVTRTSGIHPSVGPVAEK